MQIFYIIILHHVFKNWPNISVYQKSNARFREPKIWLYGKNSLIAFIYINIGHYLRSMWPLDSGLIGGQRLKWVKNTASPAHPQMRGLLPNDQNCPLKHLDTRTHTYRHTHIYIYAHMKLYAHVYEHYIYVWRTLGQIVVTVIAHSKL